MKVFNLFCIQHLKVIYPVFFTFIFKINESSLVTSRGTLLMETGLLHDYFGNFSMRGERYYFT